MVKFVYTLLLIVIEWYTVKEKKQNKNPPPPKKTPQTNKHKRCFEKGLWNF